MLNDRIVAEIVNLADHAPFYLYDGTQLEDSLNQLQKLSSVASIYYAMKANPHLEVVKSALRHTAISGIEIASVGEAETCLSAGEKSLEKVIYTGPGKTFDDLQFVIGNNVSLITIESLLEAHRINTIANRLGRVQDVLLRINTSLEIHGASKQLTSNTDPSAFGVDEEQAAFVLSQVNDLKNVCVRGIHTYSATGVLDARALGESISYSLDLFSKLRKETQISFDVLDLGGGFGVDYSGNSAFDVDTYEQLLRQHIFDYGLTDIKFFLELGRFIAAPMGYFVTPITDIKKSNRKKVVVCEAGTNAHKRPQVLDIKYPVDIIPLDLPNLYSLQNSVDNEYAKVVGPLCTSVDVLHPNIFLPSARVGDLLVMSKSGAYGYTMSPTKFLSNDKTKEFFLEEKI